ncbi:ribonuclease H-like domain-containing protein, partial [Tanacetum coccineum]
SYYAPSAQRRSLSPKRVSTVRQAVNTVRNKMLRDSHTQIALKDKGIADSGCSRHMTGTKEYLSDYQEIKGGFVAFGEGKGRITGKGNIKTNKLDFDDVYYVNGLKFNLFSVSQMCDKKNSVLFTETECLILSPNFKLLDESQVVLRIPRQNNMYYFDLQNIVPTGDLTCLFAKASSDESNLWHRRLGHVNSKTMNKLVKGNLVRGLPSKLFENDHSYVACQKGKQHKATWIIREFSNARTPQQNGVAERKNRTLIEAARTMLADLLLLVIFWAETVNTACYVLNMVLVTKTKNKTPYELINGRTPLLSFLRPFRCPVTILNTLDPFGKFEGKADEGFLVGYSIHKDTTSDKPFVLLPLWPFNSSFSSKSSANKEVIDSGKKTDQELAFENDQKCYDQGGAPISSSTKTFSVVHTPVNRAWRTDRQLAWPTLSRSWEEVLLAQ